MVRLLLHPFKGRAILAPKEGAGHPIKLTPNVAQIAARDAPGKPIEIWFEDEARIGQKN
jgi:hypothetical protein